MDFRLLVDLDAIEFLQTLPTHERRRLYRHFREIQKYPGHHSNLTGQDEEGRDLNISAFEGLRIYYWIDDADRHIKILEVKVTD